MWKYVTRGIRESIERRASCRTNVYSQTSQEGSAKSEVRESLLCNQKSLIPSILGFKNGCCGSAKVGGTKGGQQESGWNTKHTWSEAVGWSSALAVGWVVCQSLCMHRRFFGADPEKAWRKRIAQAHDIRISHLLGQVLNFQPHHVLPVTNCVGNDGARGNNDPEEQNWAPQKPYGPITVEEALQEAGNEFSRTHKLVMGELELRLGVKALKQKNYKEAVKHFSNGANLSSPASMFNLALCYEMGLGTYIDNAKAAKYYRVAADNGHAGAMYNLGVFHAQGRGGVALDMNVARKLFTEAAKLGQPEAQHALDLEKPSPQPKMVNKTLATETMNFTDKKTDSVQGNNSISSVLIQLVGYKDRAAVNQDAKSNSQIPYSKQRIDQMKSPTEIFLDILGLQQPSPVPVTGSVKDTVPY